MLPGLLPAIMFGWTVTTFIAMGRLLIQFPELPTKILMLSQVIMNIMLKPLIMRAIHQCSAKVFS